MNHELRVHNSLTGKKETFRPIDPTHVGMYVCGPTVYSNAHIGNCRTYVSFDVIYRWLLQHFEKVRYVRNITDVGHILDDGEDRMARGARLERLEPMEVAQKYTLDFQEKMRLFNNLPPSIEPRATGHIPEQIEMVEAILSNGWGYERNGSVYFSVEKFARDKPDVYGQVSGRVLDDLYAETRALHAQDEKDHPADFAIWMKAKPEHLMRWRSKWSEGFPGWHLECSAMSTKYLGKTFDIHGGGNDLKFPHHENEVAQNMGACGCAPANYWLHTNMLEMNGRKMSKSEGNYITPTELFTGDSPHITKAYSPMAIRYFFLQAHYRSTLNITDDGLQAAEKGFKKLMETNKILQELPGGNPQPGTEDAAIRTLLAEAVEAMNDDFNTALSIAKVNELGGFAQKIFNKQMPAAAVSDEVLSEWKKLSNTLIFNVFGLMDDSAAAGDNATVEGLMNLILEMRTTARAEKNWAASDKIRDGLAAANIQVKDGKEGTTWSRL